jgi:hypothetical protein
MSRMSQVFPKQFQRLPKSDGNSTRHGHDTRRQIFLFNSNRGAAWPVVHRTIGVSGSLVEVSKNVFSRS